MSGSVGLAGFRELGCAQERIASFDPARGQSTYQGVCNSRILGRNPHEGPGSTLLPDSSAGPWCGGGIRLCQPFQQAWDCLASSRPDPAQGHKLLVSSIETILLANGPDQDAHSVARRGATYTKFNRSSSTKVFVVDRRQHLAHSFHTRGRQLPKSLSPSVRKGRPGLQLMLQAGNAPSLDRGRVKKTSVVQDQENCQSKDNHC